MYPPDPLEGTQGLDPQLIPTIGGQNESEPRSNLDEHDKLLIQIKQRNLYKTLLKQVHRRRSFSKGTTSMTLMVPIG